MLQPLSAIPLQTDADNPRTKATKATFYLKAETVEQLETMWTDTRKLVGRIGRSQITKSLIVQTALARLAIALTDMTREETLAYLGLSSV